MGGGRIAEAKLGPLRDAGASVRAVALRHRDNFLREARNRGGVELITGAFVPAHLEGVRLVVSATEDRALNAQVAREARARGIFCNAVDDPASCDAFFAASFRRGPWHLAIGTEGAFPGLCRTLREVLDLLIPDGYGADLADLVRIRNRLKAALPDPEVRRQRLEGLLNDLRRTCFPVEEILP